MRVAPVAPAKATPHGGYGYQRARRRHAGLDIGARPGTRVVAPERMTVTAVAFNNATPPLSDYGPAAVMARGDSGVVHVLGHLQNVWPGAQPKVGDVYEAGALVGFVSDLNHVHWEVRRGDRAPWPVASRLADTLDPLAWLAERVDGVDDTVLDKAAAMARGLRGVIVQRVVSGWVSVVLGMVVVNEIAKSRRR